MAYISFQPKDYFNTKLYTGNGSTNAQTGIGFLPSWTWIKNRGDTHAHVLVDAVRGVTKELRSSGDNAEITTTNSFTSFDSDGFTLGADSTDSYNKNSNNYVSWNWLANGQGSSNTDGSINTTYTSADTTSGFSIVKYTGTGSNATVGTGLNAVPKMIIVKCLDQTHWWFTYHVSLGNTKHITLNTTNAVSGASAVYWNNTTPTSSVFSIGTDTGVNQSGQDYIAYCFAEKQGFSKFGSYTGNGNADGAFIYTGFKPAFVLFKQSSSAGNNWTLQDNKREGFNPNNRRIFPNDASAENTSSFRLDMLSNGFKLNNSDADSNGSGETYIFMAFAEAPLVGSNNVPANAR